MQRLVWRVLLTVVVGAATIVLLTGGRATLTACLTALGLGLAPLAALLTLPKTGQLLAGVLLVGGLMTIAYDMAQPDRLRREYKFAAYLVVAVSVPALVLFS